MSKYGGVGVLRKREIRWVVRRSNVGLDSLNDITWTCTVSLKVVMCDECNNKRTANRRGCRKGKW